MNQLISEEYRRLNADLHARATFGQRGGRHAPVVSEILKTIGGGTVLDYGCGRGDLKKALPQVKVVNYDPATFPEMPKPCDLVVCTDVLEHIEPDCLDTVLKHLAHLTVTVAHIVIATKLDGNKKLADGRDPHLIVKPAQWWKEKLCQHYGQVELINISNRDCTFRCS